MEGVAWYAGLFGLLGATFAVAEPDQPLQLSRHWPGILAYVGYGLAFWWFTKGHVSKRY